MKNAGRIQLRICRGVALVSALLASYPGAAEEDPFVDGQIVVELIEGGPDIAAFNAHFETTTLLPIEPREVYLLVIPSSFQGDPGEFGEHILGEPGGPWAGSAEPNYAADSAEKSGRSFFFNVGRNAAAYTQQAAWAQTGIPAAQQTTLGNGIIVAVLDTGIDATHEALAGHVLNTGWNFIDNNNDVRDIRDGGDRAGRHDDGDSVGHGTHVSGIVAFVAPEAMILPIKVLDGEGQGDLLGIAAGIFYAIDQGAHVINISAGSTYDADAVEKAVAEARNRGIIVVAPAGNIVAGGGPVPMEFPAFYGDVIGVTGVDENDLKTDFTKLHELLEIAAPGREIYSALPRRSAAAPHEYAAWNGTSMASPMVAGTAALLLAAHPEWPADAQRTARVRAALMESAADLDTLNPGFAGMLGAGRLDAAAAMDTPMTFDPAAAYAVGTAPAAVAAADFDGDGLPDLAVADSDSNTVSVLINQGGGTFSAPPISYPVGLEPSGVVIGDFDGVNGPDLAVAIKESDEVSILLNTGNGTLVAGPSITVGSEPMAIGVADLNGDNLPDLVTADSRGDTVTVLINQGGGSFTVSQTLTVGIKPRWLVIVRLDADSAPDIATADRDSRTLSILRNLGDGTFGAATSVPLGGRPRALAAGDIDGDDIVDLVVGIKGENDDPDEVRVFRNDGTARLTLSATHALPPHQSVCAVIAADLDADGDADLGVVTLNEGWNVFSVLANDGSGTLLGPLDYLVGEEPEAVLACDLDQDGDLDVVTADSFDDSVSVLINRSDPAAILGDMNCDDVLNGADIDPFFLALADPAAYQAAFPDCDPLNGDINGDGVLNGGDIDPFFACLGGGCP